jgi:hypothetical protein
METVGDCRFRRILEKCKKVLIDREAVDMSDILDDFQKKARDHARVPMQVSTGIASNYYYLILVLNTLAVGFQRARWVYKR